MKRPLIGITLDWQETGSFSKRPHYALRQAYFDAVWAAGGQPVGLPLQADGSNGYLKLVRGLVIPGGDYPTPSSWYEDPHKLEVNHPRVDVDMAFIKAALEMDLPLLAICAGYQELAIAMGGRLAWKITQTVENPLPHRKVSLDKRAHEVKLKKGTLLREIMGQATIETNSHHFEGVVKAGKAVVCGKAPDGIIEAIEVPGKKFAIGVQWHPEMYHEETDRKLFEAFVKAAQ
ncbi:MAG TPA: gamma-glutamyl-gamma-aminobutyrate hydrolase family protein [Alphaproteobacteria bacterium]|nr:gamma-glutamyl-gamma-aminobutyrate hydrolase family protein [Alphaproteobacteria bacterium]